jgi:hypothetical protein
VVAWFEYTWFIYLHPVYKIFAGLLCALLSIALVCVEAKDFVPHSGNWLGEVVVKNSLSNTYLSFLVTYLVCLLPIAYICLCANFGMMNIKIGSIYALHTNQMTDPACLVQSAMWITKLSVAVAYNFLKIIEMKDCAFFRVMGPISNIDFIGSKITKYLYPSCLLVMAFFTLFRIF